VVGDGKNSILALIKQKKLILRGKKIEINPNDTRIRLKLKHQGLTLKTILPKGEKVHVLYNANLSAGAKDVDVTKTIHPAFKKISTNLTKDMGLRLCGVDIMVTKGDITRDPKSCSYYIIEINSAIGIEPTETTYLKILKALGKKD
jgi:D-alanine-D-alanine ligase-like ATP-grasp enzyme